MTRKRRYVKELFRNARCYERIEYNNVSVLNCGRIVQLSEVQMSRNKPEYERIEFQVSWSRGGII